MYANKPVCPQPKSCSPATVVGGVFVYLPVDTDGEGRMERGGGGGRASRALYQLFSELAQYSPSATEKSGLC